MAITPTPSALKAAFDASQLRGPYQGVIKAVNGLDGNGEGAPETITYDVEVNINGVKSVATGIANSWRSHTNTIDGVSVFVKPLPPGTPVFVWAEMRQICLCFPERLKLRACPPSTIQNSASIDAAIMARLALLESTVAAMQGGSSGA